MNHGFIKTATAVPVVKVADCHYNANQILALIKEAEKKGVELLTFPELSITSYSCGDLFLQPILHKEAERALAYILSETTTTNAVVAVGMPVAHKGMLLNCVVILHKGKISGIVAKNDS